MSEHSCARCNAQEYIPTYQYVKLADKSYYICKSCYEEAQSWLKRRSSVRISKFVPLS